MEAKSTFSLPAQTISVHQGDIEAAIGEAQYDFPFKLINVVALGILKLKDDVPINFEVLETKLPDIRRLNRFPCILFKIDNISVILFKNGKLILTGIKSQADIPVLKGKIIKTLEKGDIHFSEFDIKIQNLVVMSHLDRIINLEMACLQLTNCLYEPEQFPAAIIKPTSGGTFLLFSNSKIIGLGMRTMAMVETSLRNLIQDIFDFDLFIEPMGDFDDLEDLFLDLD